MSHGLCVLIRCSPFHKILDNGKSMCGIRCKETLIHYLGWIQLPESRCKRCVKIYGNET